MSFVVCSKGFLVSFQSRTREGGGMHFATEEVLRYMCIGKIVKVWLIP